MDLKEVVASLDSKVIVAREGTMSAMGRLGMSSGTRKMRGTVSGRLVYS